MKLTVYKGFNQEFLETLQEQPLVDGEISQKKNVLEFDKSTRKKLAQALILLDEDDSVWITYEEYALINKRIDDAVEEDGLILKIFRNNLYPDYFPIDFSMSPELATEIIDTINGDTRADNNESEECKRYLAVYSTISEINGIYYGSFYEYEYEHLEEEPVEDFYPFNITIEEGQIRSDYDVFINEDIDTYLRDL